jgi:large repetitive protein
MTSTKSKLYLTVLICCTLILGPVLAGCVSESPASLPFARTYSTDADFGEGVCTGLEIAQNCLHLCQQLVDLPFIWVPNDDGTVSKVNTETGDELGRYRVVPPGLLPENGSPSRTTVDHEGNVWVGLRTAGTVVKIGLCEAGGCIDRNEDGMIRTSQDLDGDGDITGAELLAWGEDECVLLEVVLVSEHEGAYVPGTYDGPYDTDYWGTAPRSLAVDADNNLWAGTGSSQRFYCIDGDTGKILDVLDVAPWEHSAYGATIDKNGVIWSVRPLLRIDPASLEPVHAPDFPYYAYGLTPDYLGHLFVTGGDTNKLYKIDIESGEIVFAKDTLEGCARGVAVTAKDNNVWVADSCRDSVLRYDNDGNLIVEIEGFEYPSGVAADAAGKVWVSDMASEYIHRIDPDMNAADLSKRLVGTWGHYSYGALTTGVVSTAVTTNIGTWTVVCDSDQAETMWEAVSWNSSEPDGTLIEAEVRSSDDLSTWSDWETAQNGVPLAETPDGRYLEIKLTLQITDAEPSPVLYDVTAESAGTAEPASGCFIASAAYGTPMADEVQVLRQFRDKCLLTTPPGAALAELYYTASPLVAAFITEHPVLKPVARLALLPAVVMSAMAIRAISASGLAG